MNQISYLTTLVANELLIQTPHTKIDVWKTFYGNVLSAIEGNKGGDKHPNVHYNAVQAILKTILPENETVGHVLGPKLKYEYRQNETRDMAIRTHLHIGNFMSRLRKYIKCNLICLQIKLSLDPVINTRLTHKLLECVVCVVDDVNTKWASFTEMAHELLDKSAAAKLLQNVYTFVHAERMRLGELVHHGACNATKTKKRKRDTKESVPPNWVLWLKKETEMYRFIAPLQHYSNWALEWWDQNKDESNWHTIFKYESNRPKTFSLLPINKFQPRHIEYTWTVFSQLLVDVRDTRVKKIEDTLHKRLDYLRKVYRCTEKKEQNKWHMLEQKLRTKEQIARLLQLQQEFQLDLFTELFDAKCVKRLRKLKASDAPVEWRVASFSTNGVQLCITFVSGTNAGSPNIADLIKKGYQISEPVAPIDVCNQPRGVYHLRQGNEAQTIQLLKPGEQIKAVPVDPGVFKPIESIPTIIGTTKTSIDQLGLHCIKAPRITLTEKEYKEQSGRGWLERYEKRHRKLVPEYKCAINAMRTQRKKCAANQIFASFCQTFFKHFNVMRRERINVARSKMNWTQTRRNMSHIARIADLLFERNTIRVERATKSIKKTERATTAMRNTYRAKINEIKHARAASHDKVVVFFGDGAFKSAYKGHISIPKKKILKELASRGLTILLDEYNTSKMCPCGTSALQNKNTSKGCRLRCHTTDGSDNKCCIENTLGAENMDRDVLAVLNLTMCTQHALLGLPRPTHLCRLMASNENVFDTVPLHSNEI